MAIPATEQTGTLDLKPLDVVAQPNVDSFVSEEWHDLSMLYNQETCAFAALMASIFSAGVLLYLGICWWVISTI